MLRRLRIILATICIIVATFLFLDFTNTIHLWFGWLAKIQFIPSILAMNFMVIAFLIVLTILFGRVYCSVICPLGIFQDVVSNRAGKLHKNRFSYSPALNKLRYIVLFLFCVMIAVGILAFGVNLICDLLDPYSIFGRFVSSFLSPLYKLGNNLLAYFAERMDSYTFYTVDVWLKSLPVLIISIIFFAVIFVLSWKNGRTYCNTICPVGSVLGLVSRFSIFKPRIDVEKCNSCGLCARNCKSSCINFKEHKIDYSRCVSCMDCLEKCKQNAISFGVSSKKVGEASTSNAKSNIGRRAFLSISALFAATTVLNAQQKKVNGIVQAVDKKVDGGLQPLTKREIPKRLTEIKPAGALSISRFKSHCTACQLCVSVCPNEVLRPSSKFENFMQPEMSYEKGFCRPECSKCSEVCPTDAIKPISVVDKSSIQIGHAVWNKDLCIVNKDGVSCGNCARHCPTGAIHMMSIDGNEGSPEIPIINTSICIGCGSCEYLCPARPLSAIYVEGHEVQKKI